MGMGDWISGRKGCSKMIQISQLKLDIHHNKKDLEKKILKTLRIPETMLIFYKIKKQSIDARKKPQLFYVYTVCVEAKQEAQIIKKCKNSNVKYIEAPITYQFIPSGEEVLKHRPVIIGTGPAGLFCGYFLARNGFLPILLERGADVDTRQKNVEEFWATGKLSPNSNVQFGEGGAGTFSDGKLNTLVHDPKGRNQKVLELFVEAGADPEILYQQKPHVGTDVLAKVVKNLRQDIIAHGGEVRFYSQVTDIIYAKDKEQKTLSKLQVTDTVSGESYELETDLAVLAIGHSARDTFEMLLKREIPMEQKSFAVGVRVEHPQSMINESQYGPGHEDLPAAAYKLSAKTSGGRGVYTFCMCPGGYVVNASSENGRLAVNGMSYHKRDGKNANSAVIATVTPEDFPGDSVLSGLEFQRQLEEKAYRAGNGKIPVQRFKDFCENKATDPTEETMESFLQPQMKGPYVWSNVRNIFPEEIGDALEEGIHSFDKRLSGYGREDAIVSGVESRTSSPVRITRDENFLSSIAGLYPCGEGAGYAGGITSAAMDGMKVAEAIMTRYRKM